MVQDLGASRRSGTGFKDALRENNPDQAITRNEINESDERIGGKFTPCSALLDLPNMTALAGLKKWERFGRWVS